LIKSYVDYLAQAPPSAIIECIIELLIDMITCYPQYSPNWIQSSVQNVNEDILTPSEKQKFGKYFSPDMKEGDYYDALENLASRAKKSFLRSR
jgi:hypothetical protein